MHMRVASLTRVSFIGLLLLVLSPISGAAQSCALCKKHTDGTCNIPTVDNDCGCCPTGQIEP